MFLLSINANPTPIPKPSVINVPPNSTERDFITEFRQKAILFHLIQSVADTHAGCRYYAGDLTASSYE